MRIGHLMLREQVLPSSEEWVIDFSGWCFARVARGVGYARLAGKAQELEEGVVLAVCLTQRLVFRASLLGEMRLHWFRLCPELLAGFFTLHEEHYLESVAPQSSNLLRFFPATHGAARQFAELSALLSSENDLVARGRMLDVVVSVLNQDMARRRHENGAHPDAGERFNQLVASLPAAEIQNCTLGDLAWQCGCSERHFSRLFRSQFGYSIRAKQMDLRFQKARQLLRESDAKIMHVAMESGFRHIGLFNAMFKKRFGVTPSEWRKQHAQVEPRRVLRLVS